MLVLGRKKDEAICLDNGIRILVVDIKGDMVRLGITAPDGVTIMRDEILETLNISQENFMGGTSGVENKKHQTKKADTEKLPKTQTD